MPLYMASFSYKPEIWAGLIRSPENREETVRRILEEAGCKLRGFWYAFGENPLLTSAHTRASGWQEGSWES